MIGHDTSLDERAGLARRIVPRRGVGDVGLNPPAMLLGTPVRPPAEAFLQLQRSVGNRATTSVVRAPSAMGQVQRRKDNERIDAILVSRPAVHQAILEWRDALEHRVDDAEKYVISLGCLHFNSRPGHMGKFEELLLDQLAGTLEASKWNTAATKAGYWIEEYATNFTLPAKPAPGVNELGWKYQVASGKTRPDIELLWNFGGSTGIERAGWVDITSSSQVGHIDKKVSTLWQRGLPYVCEVFYESIDFNGLAASLKALKGDRSKAPATSNAALAQVAEYNKHKNAQRARQQEWAGVLSTLGAAVLAHDQIVNSKRKAAMRLSMCHLLGVTKDALKPKDAAAVLLAAGLVPMNYKWPSRTGATAPDGWAWLESNKITKPPDAGDIPAAVGDAVADLVPTVEMTDA